MRTIKKINTLSEFPDFSSMDYDEEASWWDVHDISPVFDKLKTVQAKLIHSSERSKDVVVVPVLKYQKKYLSQVALQEGVSVATLISNWLKEKINESKMKSTSAT